MHCNWAKYLLYQKDGKLCGHAKDPISSGLALENFVPDNYWINYDGDVLLLGAGGSTLAMSVYFSQEKFGDNVPKKLSLQIEVFQDWNLQKKYWMVLIQK